MFRRTRNYKNENDHLIVMENLSKDKTLKSEQLIDLSFALGKAYEDKDFQKENDDLIFYREDIGN